MDDITSIVEKVIRNFNHELKNPLTTIKGYAQLLGSKAHDPKFIEKSRNIIIENVDYIDSKMNQMYDIFNLPEGERELLSPGKIIEDYISSCDVTEQCFLSWEDYSNDKTATGDQNYFTRIIDVLFHGFDWKNHPNSKLKMLLHTNDNNIMTLSFCFENADFSHLTKANYYLPFSEKRYFISGIELFEVFFLSYLSGWNFTYSATTPFGFSINLK